MDFSIGRTIGLLTRTAPFILFRLIVYLGIVIAYVLAVGVGAGIGAGFGYIGGDTGAGGTYGGLFGFVIVSGALYFLREYLLYLVKAGHIAVLTELIDGRKPPGGRGQIDYAQQQVRARFAQSSVMFGLDQLIKGILRAINRTLFSIAQMIPIPGLEGLAKAVNQLMNLSLTYTDEIILAHNFRQRSTNAWQTSQEALILYAQNYKAIIKNAFFLMLILWGLTLLLFLVVLLPAGLFVALVPGAAGIWTLVFAVVLTWALKAAVLDPFAMAALMQVYFKVVEGQRPNPEWDARLTDLSGKFRELKQKAVEHAHAAGPTTAAAATAPTPPMGRPAPAAAAPRQAPRPPPPVRPAAAPSRPPAPPPHPPEPPAAGPASVPAGRPPPPPPAPSPPHGDGEETIVPPARR